MANKINVRSPFYVKAEDSLLATATLKLYIYTGAQLSTPTTNELRYTLNKSTIGSNTYIVFEISELIRDYLDIEFDGEYDSQCVWVTTEMLEFQSNGNIIGSPYSTDYVALDGYGYFEEGTNPELSRGLLMTNNTILRLNYDNVRIPVFAEDTNSVSFFYKGEEKRTQSISYTANTNSVIDYITLSGLDNNDTYRERVVNDGGTLEDSVCLKEFQYSFDIGEVDKVIINTDNGIEVIKIITINECKYTPYKVTFVNKYGALQDLWFFKKSTETTNVRSNTYKASIFDQSTLEYKTHKHQQQSYMTQGKDVIVMNTGFVNDDFNSVMEELLLSEQVWYTVITETEERIVPVTPLTKSVTYKTSLNDMLASYTVQFEHSFDKINNVR